MEAVLLITVHFPMGQSYKQFAAILGCIFMGIS